MGRTALRNEKAFTLGTIACAIMTVAYAAIAIMGLVNREFPLGYRMEVFTTNKIGTVILFLAAAAELVTIIITRIVYDDFEKINLPIILWVLGGAASVATLSACSSIAKSDKPEKK